jgi:hypothetical protein
VRELSRLSADGQYVRQIGWTLSRTGRWTQVKFRLGANRKEAMRRDQIIRSMWDQLGGQGDVSTGSDEALAAAKGAAATGRARTLATANLPPNTSLASLNCKLGSKTFELNPLTHR